MSSHLCLLDEVLGYTMLRVYEVHEGRRFRITKKEKEKASMLSHLKAGRPLPAAPIHALGPSTGKT